MSSCTRRTRRFAAFSVASSLLVGCGAGASETSQQQAPSADSTSATIGAEQFRAEALVALAEAKLNTGTPHEGCPDLRSRFSQAAVETLVIADRVEVVGDHIVFEDPVRPETQYSRVLSFVDPEYVVGAEVSGEDLLEVEVSQAFGELILSPGIDASVLEGLSPVILTGRVDSGDPDAPLFTGNVVVGGTPAGDLVGQPGCSDDFNAQMQTFVGLSGIEAPIEAAVLLARASGDSSIALPSAPSTTPMDPNAGWYNLSTDERGLQPGSLPEDELEKLNVRALFMDFSEGATFAFGTDSGQGGSFTTSKPTLTPLPLYFMDGDAELRILEYSHEDGIGQVIDTVEVAQVDGAGGLLLSGDPARPTIEVLSTEEVAATLEVDLDDLDRLAQDALDPASD